MNLLDNDVIDNLNLGEVKRSGFDGSWLGGHREMFGDTRFRERMELKDRLKYMYWRSIEVLEWPIEFIINRFNLGAYKVAEMYRIRRDLRRLRREHRMLQGIFDKRLRLIYGKESLDDLPAYYENEINHLKMLEQKIRDRERDAILLMARDTE